MQQPPQGWGPPGGGYGTPYGGPPQGYPQQGYPQGYPQPPKKGGFPVVGCLIAGGVGVVLLMVVGVVLVFVAARGASSYSSYSPPVATTDSTDTSATDPTSASTGVDTSDWSKFSSTSGKFEVLFPTKPKEDKTTIQTDVGAVPADNIISEDGTTVYMASFVNYGVTFTGNKDKILDAARDGAVSKIHGKVSSESNITVDGSPGRDVVMTAKQSGISLDVHAKFILVMPRLYILQVLCPSGGDTTDAQAFFDSFKLNK
jgi:hypothetical protein